MDDRTELAPRGYRYVGAGAYLQGVPARDLTSDEADDYGREAIEKSGLYEREA